MASLKRQPARDRQAGGPRYQALLRLLRASDGLWNSSRLFFARWDISPSQFNVLNLLSDEPGGLAQIELGRRLIMHRSNVTGLVDRLEERGLLRRDSNTRDRRAYRVALTARGHELLRRILPAYYRAAEQVWGSISPSDAGQLAAELERLSLNASGMVSGRGAAA